MEKLDKSVVLDNWIECTGVITCGYACVAKYMAARRDFFLVFRSRKG